MDLKKLYWMQTVLDKRIKEEKGLHGQELIKEKILALLVEIGELANETRCFKFWSGKGPSKREVILEEYVDGLHFLLSIGLEFNHTPYVIESYQVKSGKLTEQFTTLIKQVAGMEMWADKTTFKQFMTYYKEAFSLFMGLGELLGFTGEEIQAAYESKNQINHERQEQGY